MHACREKRWDCTAATFRETGHLFFSSRTEGGAPIEHEGKLVVFFGGRWWSGWGSGCSLFQQKRARGDIRTRRKSGTSINQNATNTMKKKQRTHTQLQNEPSGKLQLQQKQVTKAPTQQTAQQLNLHLHNTQPDYADTKTLKQKTKHQIHGSNNTATNDSTENTTRHTQNTITSTT